MSDSISVVIPTYNSAAFIRQTLASVFEQTRPAREVIVVDDASTDDTPRMVAAMASVAPVAVHLLRQETNSGGPAKPLNRGITRAAGPLIATLDHDDLMLPAKLELQADCLRRAPGLGLVLGRCAPYPADRPSATLPCKAAGDAIAAIPRVCLGQRLSRLRARDAYETLVRAGNFALSCSNLLFPRAVWQRCGGFDETLVTACDFGFVQQVARDYDLGFVDEPVIRWRQRVDSLFRTSHRLARDEEKSRIYARFQPTLLSPSARKALKRQFREGHLGLAYSLRQEGRYRQALASYVDSIRQGGWSLESALGLVKLLPYQLLRRRGSRVRNAEKSIPGGREVPLFGCGAIGELAENALALREPR